MTILKCLSFIGTATIALSPFTLLISSSGKGVLPALNNHKLQGNNFSGGGVNTNYNQNNQLLKAESSTEQSLEIKQLPKGDSNLSIEKAYGGENLQLGKELLTRINKKEANLNDWLDMINPLIRTKQNLFVISKGNSRYFKILQGDQECQCFVASDSELGIGTNGSGLFTIGKKTDNPQDNAASPLTNQKCTKFNSFGYQNGNTGGRLHYGIQTAKTNEKSNTAVSSCYKDPVFFLGTNTAFPIFLKQKGSRNMTTVGIRNNDYFNYRTGKFEKLEDGSKIPDHFFKVSSYLDGKKLGNIKS